MACGDKRDKQHTRSAYIDVKWLVKKIGGAFILLHSTQSTLLACEKRKPSMSRRQRSVNPSIERSRHPSTDSLANQLADGLSLNSFASLDIPDHNEPSKPTAQRQRHSIGDKMPPRALLQHRPPAVLMQNWQSASALDLDRRRRGDGDKLTTTNNNDQSTTRCSVSSKANATPANNHHSLRRVSSQQRNYTFSATQLRDIERTNELLARKIIATKPSVRRARSTTNLHATAAQQQQQYSCTAPATINRRRQQQQIDRGNDLMQQRLLRIATRRTKMVPI